MREHKIPELVVKKKFFKQKYSATKMWRATLDPDSPYF
ncbi:hypothetical protein HBZS_100810 [Helicobacter bizzozeronii CCUG 35545]|nr:hypothetical protein HBZS_100810 [Helicobacter bizzozeronii CCUG 35545]